MSKSPRARSLAEKPFAPDLLLCDLDDERRAALTRAWCAVRALALSAAASAAPAEPAAWLIWPADMTPLNDSILSTPLVRMQHGAAAAPSAALALLARLRAGFRLPLSDSSAREIFDCALAAVAKSINARQAAAWTGELFEWPQPRPGGGGDRAPLLSRREFSRARVGAVSARLEQQLTVACAGGRGIHWLDRPPALSFWARNGGL